MDKSHSIRMYIGVLSYFSVAFMAVSGLPAYIMDIVQRDHPRASRDEVAKMTAYLTAIFSFSNACSALLVAGWAGKLSDHFGRRRCAAVPALGQAIGMGLLALAAHLRLSWQWSLAAWVTTGLLGGPYVFLSAAFAYIADFTRISGRGKAFSRLDASRNQNRKGVGLGLAIARDVARGHGGDITLDRSPMGGILDRVREHQETRFRFRQLLIL